MKDYEAATLKGCELATNGCVGVGNSLFHCLQTGFVACGAGRIHAAQSVAHVTGNDTHIVGGGPQMGVVVDTRDSRRGVHKRQTRVNFLYLARPRGLEAQPANKKIGSAAAQLHHLSGSRVERLGTVAFGYHTDHLPGVACHSLDNVAVGFYRHCKRGTRSISGRGASCKKRCKKEYTEKNLLHKWLFYLEKSSATPV